MEMSRNFYSGGFVGTVTMRPLTTADVVSEFNDRTLMSNFSTAPLSVCLTS